MRKNSQIIGELHMRELMQDIPKNFPSQHARRFADYLDQMRLKRILHMTILRLDKEAARALDVGCGNGALSQVLSQACQTVGVDVEKARLSKNRNENLDFLIGNIIDLPFNKGSFDLIVCASVLEHMLDLDLALTQLKRIMKTGGILIAGYPVETHFFKMLWRFASPREFKAIDQTQTFFVDPVTMKVEDYWKHPATHKQTYLTVREALNRHFRLIQRVKLPFRFLPDFAAYYECSELIS